MEVRAPGCRACRVPPTTARGRDAGARLPWLSGRWSADRLVPAPAGCAWPAVVPRGPPRQPGPPAAEGRAAAGPGPWSAPSTGTPLLVIRSPGPPQVRPGLGPARARLRRSAGRGSRTGPDAGAARPSRPADDGKPRLAARPRRPALLAPAATAAGCPAGRRTRAARADRNPGGPARFTCPGQRAGRDQARHPGVFWQPEPGEPLGQRLRAAGDRIRGWPSGGAGSLASANSARSSSSDASAARRALSRSWNSDRASRAHCARGGRPASQQRGFRPDLDRVGIRYS